MFISSISARVGALSRMRRRDEGRDDGRGPGSDTDRSMQEVDLTLQGQVWARQGRDPNAEGGGSKQHSKEDTHKYPVQHFSAEDATLISHYSETLI